MRAFCATFIYIVFIVINSLLLLEACLRQCLQGVHLAGAQLSSSLAFVSGTLERGAGTRLAAAE